MQTTFPTTPTPNASTVWRRDLKAGVRQAQRTLSPIIRAHENNDYSALLRAIKSRTMYFDGCWLWTGWVRDDGSAWVSLRVKQVRVRRLVSEAYIGAPLDSRDKIFSTCSHTECVNPDHLEIRVFKR